MAPVHPLSTFDIGTAMPGPVDKAKSKLNFKIVFLQIEPQGYR